MKYGVMLLEYDGMPFYLWVHEGEGKLQLNSQADAVKKAEEWSSKNPKGKYAIKPID